MDAKVLMQQPAYAATQRETLQHYTDEVEVVL